MANPSWVTSENVKFKGTLDNAVVLDNTAGIRSLILWDSLSVADQTLLTDFINSNGGALPLAGPTSGHQLLDFGGTIVGNNATGLNNVSTATAGSSTINVGGAHITSDASGLSASAGTQGHQVANFNGTLTNNTLTKLAPYSGYQYVNLSAISAGTDATNLANTIPATSGNALLAFNASPTITATTVLGLSVANYQLGIAVDGTGSINYTIALTGTSTLTSIAAALNLLPIAGATVSVSGNTLVVTSNSTGISSAIVITAGTASDLITAINLATTATNTNIGTPGTAAIVTTYTTTVTVNGVAKAVSIIGSAAQTFNALISALNTAISPAVATLDVPNHRIVITSNTTGPASTILTVQGTLFAAPLANFVNISASVPGNSVTALTATVIVDGTTNPISILPVNITHFSDLVTQLNANLTGAVASISGGNLVISSNSYGVYSTIQITDGTLFAALSGFVELLPVAPGGSSARVYSATITVDGTIQTVRFTGAQGNTFQHVLDEINADLGTVATATLTNGNIVITSATTGLQSSVRIDDNGFLFNLLNGYVGITTTNSTAPIYYLTTIFVDGTDHVISIQGSTAQTFTALVSGINTALAGTAVVSISGGNLVVTSASTGIASTILVVDSTLFKAIGIIGTRSSTTGIVSILTAIKTPTNQNGIKLSDQFDILTIGSKPHVPAIPAVLPKTQYYTYFDGTVWKYLADDTNV